MKEIIPEETVALKSKLLSVRDALDILGGKWKIPILLSLSCGKKRFKEIQRDITGITAKMLSKELKELEMNQIILRTISNSSFGVEYSVTIYCKSLEKIIDGLKEWGDHHRTLIFNLPKENQHLISSVNNKEPIAQQSIANSGIEHWPNNQD